MKRIFLVKRDPGKPASADNWISMNYRRFRAFLDTPEGNCRRKRFAILDSCCSGDRVIVIETEEDIIYTISSEHNRCCYLRRTGELACEIYGLHTEQNEEACSRIPGKIFSSEAAVSVEDAVEKRIMTERMRDAVGRLGNEERRLITYCMLMENGCTEEIYAKAVGKSRQEINLQKRRILTKLRKDIENAG